MAGDDKKAKPTLAPKAEVASPKKDASPPKEKDKSASAAGAPKAETGETAAASPSSYSRGEGQKPVSQAYKDNWNAIYGKKSKKNKKR